MQFFIEHIKHVCTNMYSHITQYFLLTDENQHPSEVDLWRVSALRIILATGFFLCLAIVIHSSAEALRVNLTYVLILTCSFYLAMSVQLWMSRKYFYLSAYTLLLTIVAAGICINVFVKSPDLSKLGSLFLYSTPLVAFVLLGKRVGLICMGLNLIPFILLVEGVYLGNAFGNAMDLQHSNLYLHSLFFLFFNICVPLSVARASVAAEKLYSKVRENNQILQSKNDLYRSFFVDAKLAQFLIEKDGKVFDQNKEATLLFGKEIADSDASVFLTKLLPEWQLDSESAIISKRFGKKKRVYSVTSQAIANSNRRLITLEDMSATLLLKKTLEQKSHSALRSKHIDASTGLPNRNWMEATLARSGQSALATNIIVVELTNAHFVEQKYGTKQLPLIQKYLAEVMNAETANIKRVAILGAHQLLIEFEQQDKIKARSQVFDLFAMLPKNYSGETHTVPLEFRMGIAFSEQAKSPEELINCAVHAAVTGQNRVNFYTNQDKIKFIEKEEISLLLNESVANNELYVEYQPKVDKDGCSVRPGSPSSLGFKNIGASFSRRVYSHC